MPFQLYGRLILQMNVHVLTGLHVGGAGGKVEIGGVDSPVIRDPLTNQPYLPGSSVRGKMRSLTERIYGREQNQSIGQGVRIHTLLSKDKKFQAQNGEVDLAKYHEAFRADETVSIFGVTGDEPVPHPTALIVRDAKLSEESAERLKKAATDLPYTEVKWEATIDRVTSAATPRQIERVPAGAIFAGLEMIYNIYGQSNLDHFPVLLKALNLVEEDYLGGLGARGSGKVRFELTKVAARKGAEYTEATFALKPENTIAANTQAILDWVTSLQFVAQTNHGG
ncbi:MAG: type III-A CRISPR-associated RAMP protein Csm3 [Caldilineaceae bacterium]